MHRLLPYLLFAGLAACASPTGLFSAAETDAETRAAGAGDDGPMDVQGLAVYLALMRDLVEGDAVTQADAFADAADAAEITPTTTNRLKYALALAMPGHLGTDERAAERELSLLLGDNTLLPEERVLAQIHLSEVERRLVLDASAERLRTEIAAAEAAADEAAAAELEVALAENRRLQQELADATQKLEAITSIEQTIRERDP